LEQRVYINGFPKAGTHLVEQMVRQIAAPITDRPWLGSFARNSWSTEMAHIDRALSVIGQFPAGGYLKGHMGWHPDISEAFRNAGVAMIFIHRDLRDVAVSTTYHILNDEVDENGNDKLVHPGKEAFRALGGFHDILKGVIVGIPGYPGVVERWQHYKPWLYEKWVLSLSFSEIVNNPQMSASLMLRYVAGVSARLVGCEMILDKRDHDYIVATMIEAMKRPTTTKRRGVPGGFRDVWNMEIEEVYVSTLHGAKTLRPVYAG
ncbi:MAG: hypothetical protein VKQ33_16385, partial [Candidatus Sericytochromatia bacterium]|nr:hypothetical protein [Candidatus Sericytochromatia bacterium]